MFTYHFLLISQVDLFTNQVLEEVLRERANFYISQNKRQDFWILTFPNFIKNENFLEKIKNTIYYKKNKNILYALDNKYPFFSAIVSCNKDFINWISLRTGYFETINFLNTENSINNNDNIDQTITSNGLKGNFTINQIFEKNLNLLNSSNSYLHPDVYLNKYKKILKYSYSLLN